MQMLISLHGHTLVPSSYGVVRTSIPPYSITFTLLQHPSSEKKVLACYLELMADYASSLNLFFRLYSEGKADVIPRYQMGDTYFLHLCKHLADLKDHRAIVLSGRDTEPSAG